MCPVAEQVNNAVRIEPLQSPQWSTPRMNEYCHKRWTGRGVRDMQRTKMCEQRSLCFKVALQLVEASI